MKRILRYIYKTLLMLVTLVIVVIAIAAGVIQTGLFKRKLADIVEKKGSEYVNGELLVREIKGNFFSAIALHDLLVKDNADTVIYIKEIRADYNLWPLLGGKMVVSSAIISKPYLFLKQFNDSTWNIQGILVLPEPTEKNSTKKSSFEINVAKFALIDGSIQIESTDTIIPQKIENLNTDLSLFYARERQQVTLNSINFNTTRPDFILQNLALKLTTEGKAIEVDDLLLKTALNQIEAHGKYDPEPHPNGYVRLSSTPVRLSEFEFFIPTFQPLVSPVLDMHVDLKNDSLQAELELTETDEDVLIEIFLGNVNSSIQEKAYQAVRYKIAGTLNQITLAAWSGLKDLNYILNGNLLAEGAGLEPETAVASLEGVFRNSVVDQWLVNQLSFEFDIDHGNLQGYTKGLGDFGEFEVYPVVHDLMGDRPSYNLNLLTRQLDLAKLTGIDSLQSDINMKADIIGAGFDPEDIQANAGISVISSGIYGILVDTLLAEVVYAGKNLKIDSLSVKTETAEATAYGNYSLNAGSEMMIIATIESLEEVKRFVPLKSDARASGTIDAYLRGVTDSLNIDVLVALSDVAYDSIYSDTINLDVEMVAGKNDTLIDASLVVRNLWNKSVNIDSVTASLTARPDTVFGIVHLANHQLITNIAGGAGFGDGINVRLDTLDIKYKEEDWALKQPALFAMDSVSYTLSNFRFEKNYTDSAAWISADGIFSTSGSENFRIELNNIDVAETVKSLYREIDASGKLNLVAELKGTAAQPEVTGDFKINNPVFNSYEIGEFGGKLEYGNDWLKMSSKIVPQNTGRFELSGNIPMVLRLDSLYYRLNPADSLDISLIVDEFPLAMFQIAGFTEYIEGYMNGEIIVNGTIEDPQPGGNIELQEAALKVPKYGIDYSTIDLNVDFLTDRINLDTLRIESSDGKMTGSGQVNFGSVLYKGDISNTDIKINFDRFNPVDHRQFNMEMSGDASLSGKKGEVVFEGDLNIPESEIYLPFVMNMIGVLNAPEMPKPILLRELQKAGEMQDSIPVTELLKESKESDTTKNNYFENFVGKINVKIPKNSWIKNEDFRIELSGDLELLKNNRYFEIFGTVDVVRGQYDLFGRTFIIENGTFTFQGGEEIEPDLNITANYSFRNNQRVEQKLTVNITGTVAEPKINFTLDGNVIDEGNALSYILFGRGLNELSLSQQENMAESGGTNLAKTSVSSLLASQITNFLGSKLNVDYIDVKSDGSFDNARVTVGKYITNDLFVNYEQQFGESTHQEIDRYRVEIEYELFKFLFIQLNNSSSDSGFNVIIKVNSK